MKILYVSDNRVRGNYGCRATSTALSMLIREKHEIVGVVSGRYTNFDTGNLFYYKYFPSWIYSFVGKFSKWSKIKPVFSKIFRKIAGNHYYFGNFDFVDEDMNRMINKYKKCLPANPELKEFNIDSYDFDGIVVNGEGSFIFPGWRESYIISMCMYWALTKGKKVFFMNAMFSMSPGHTNGCKTIKNFEQIFRRCSLVVVREHQSYEFVKKYMPSVNAIQVPDALFTWYDMVNDSHKVENGRYYLAHSAENDLSYFNQDFTKPYILIAGSSLILDMQKAIESYSNLVSMLKKHFEGNVYLIQVCEGDYFLNDVSENTRTPIISLKTPILAAAKMLANARVFISGRYHPSIMASLGGTPCVFMGSNSHKTRSLQELLEYDHVREYNQIPSEQECVQIVNDALCLVNSGDILRNAIKKRAFELSLEAKGMINLIK